MRQAVNLADVLDGAETITFDTTVFATPQTITLHAGQLELSDTSGIGDDHRPGGGRDHQRRRPEPGLPGRPVVTATLSGLTITGGKAGVTSSGGGLYNEGTTTLTDCTISGNSADVGGGLYNDATAKLTLTDCTISGNSAANAGGLYSLGTVNLTDCTISGNSASGVGGGLANGGAASLDLTDCTISGNRPESRRRPG